MKLKISNWSEINKVIVKHSERVLDIAADKLFQLGLETIKDARENARFYNWTNNLRSSFGVAVSVNGKIIRSDFQLFGDGLLGDGSGGLKKAQSLIDLEVNKNRNQLLLVLVAGEEYAVYVEAKENKSVLTAFALELKKKLKK